MEEVGSHVWFITRYLCDSGPCTTDDALVIKATLQQLTDNYPDIVHDNPPTPGVCHHVWGGAGYIGAGSARVAGTPSSLSLMVG